MKRFISISLITILCLGSAYGAYKKVPKGEKMMRRVEPAPIEHGHHGSTPIVMPNTRNSGTFAIVDSSANGYGMVAPNTRPLFVDPGSGNWFSAYRQYAGENTTHGQLGTAFSEDGEDWTTYYNVNHNGDPPWGGGGVVGAGVGQARYPSSVGNEDQPVAIWNEYSLPAGPEDNGSLYGGRAYYAYDEFGWDGGSFTYPVELDLLWMSDTKDHWVGSTSISYDDDMGMSVVNAVYNDWTRGDRWLFHSEAYDDGYIVMGEEQKVIDEVNDLVGGDDTGSFNTSPYVSCTPEGICGVGVVGLFLGADSDASSISNNHTGIFKMSEDHGASWHGCDGDAESGCAPSTDGSNYYFIPDAVWDDLVATQFNYDYVDECEGTTALINSFWSYYEDDFKVDRQGNPHWAIQVLGCDGSAEGFCYYTPEAGIYHFTIDRDYLDNPGPVNTATGWNWSFVITGVDTWGWADMTGDSYIWDNHASLAFSVEDPDVVYVVTNMALTGAFAGDDANLEDPCYYTTWEDYPEWSEDIYVVKSVDGGQSWWNPLNVSNTEDDTGAECEYNNECYNGPCSGDSGDGVVSPVVNGFCPESCPNGYPKCDPAEEYPHAAQWATDEGVYIMYQMPNWAFNEIGDLMGADFMNRVYIGTAIVDDSDIPEYGTAPSSCYADAGDVTDDGVINVMDIISLVNHILGSAPLDDTCAADYNADGIVNVMDIIGIVNAILGTQRANDASQVDLSINDNQLEMNADGFVSAVEFTLTHDEGFEIVLTEELNSMIGFGACSVNETSTTCVVVGPESNILFNSNASYEIEEFIAANGSGYIDVVYDSAIPGGYSVSDAYPNPFNPSTSLTIDLEKESFVSVKAYNVLGQLTAEVFDGNLNGYDNKIVWNASNVPSGVYFMQIQVGNDVSTKKVMLLK